MKRAKECIRLDAIADQIKASFQEWAELEGGLPLRLAADPHVLRLIELRSQAIRLLLEHAVLEEKRAKAQLDFVIEKSSDVLKQSSAELRKLAEDSMDKLEEEVSEVWRESLDTVLDQSGDHLQDKAGFRNRVLQEVETRIAEDDQDEA